MKTLPPAVFFVAQKYVGKVFNIISQQSTARPGCIIELDAITDFVCICSQSNLSDTKSKLPYYLLVVVLGHYTSC